MGLSTGSREINVTPLIDVLLVLLIIFLVAIPILLPTETVAIPPTETDAIAEPPPPLTLRVDADLSVSFDDGPRFPGRELAPRLRGELPRVRAVFVDAGEGVPWGVVVSTVDTVRGIAGDVRQGGMTVALRLHDH
ncbi:MAG TPA: biopolymer transporter ExbD [Kofleriaceae bacterium]|nr:biopolymer transporter ExbD [Kofleriaceae bacterium]